MILHYEEERASAERKKKFLLTVYIVVACVFVAVALLLLFLSSERYTIFMIADILVSIAFGFYSIWFFTVRYDDAVKRYRLLYKVDCALEEREYGVFLREEDAMTIDGVQMRVLLFSVRGTEREIHLFECDLVPPADKKCLLVLRAGVLVRLEECNE